MSSPESTSEDCQSCQSITSHFVHLLWFFHAADFQRFLSHFRDWALKHYPPYGFKIFKNYNKLIALSNKKPPDWRFFVFYRVPDAARTQKFWGIDGIRTRDNAATARCDNCFTTTPIILNYRVFPL